MFGWSPRKKQTIVRHLLVAFGLALVSTLALWLLFAGTWTVSDWLGPWLLAVNVTTFAFYGYDKSRSRIGSNRVPEVVLHSLTASGGGLGAYVGMRWFRHKTIKGSFRILFWLIVSIQIALIAWVLWRQL